MPTLASSAIPAPKSWDEFEEIARSSLKVRWKNSSLTRNGRQGQSQDGVDIYGEDDLGHSVGIQCRLVQDLSLQSVLEEISKAEGFVPSLDIYYIATTAPSDATLQRDIRIISKQRGSQGKFLVGILFWGDLLQDLLTDEAEFKKHFPQFVLQTQAPPAVSKGNRAMALLDLGYHGSHIQDIMQLLFSELSWEPTEFTRFVTNLKACVKVSLEGDESEEVLRELQELWEYVNPMVNGTEQKPHGWGPALSLAATIEARISAIEYSLVDRELDLYRLGQVLGDWNHLEYQHPTKKLGSIREARILELIESLFPTLSLRNEAATIIANYRSTDSIGDALVPDKIFLKIRAVL